MRSPAASGRVVSPPRAASAARTVAGAARFEQVRVTPAQAPVALVTPRRKRAALDGSDDAAGRFLHVPAVLEPAFARARRDFRKAQCFLVETVDRRSEVAHAR